MKLSSRTLIVPPLASIDLVHIVQAGASWKATLGQLFNYLFGTANPITVEFTGTLRCPVVLFMRPAPAVLPFGTAAGIYVMTPDLTLGPCCDVVSFGGTFSSTPGPVTLILRGIQSLNSYGIGSANGLTLLSFPDLLYCVSTFPGGNCADLVTINADKMIFAGAFSFGSCPLVLALSFPELQYIGGINAFAPTTLAGLATWSFPKLKSCSCNFAPTAFAVLTNLTCPLLEYVGNFTPNTMALLTTFSFPLLADVGIFAPTTMAALVTINLPALARVGGAFSVATMAALTTVSVAAMIRYASTIAIPSATCANVAAVTLGTIGTLKEIAGATVTLSGLKIPSANVNSILALLVSLDGTGGTTLWGAGKTLNISGGTNGAPTGAGIADKATLVARGATVTTN